MRLLFLAGALVAIVGCATEEPRGTVRGKVTRGGQPVSGATVLLENAAGVALTANLGDDGAFEIKTYKGAGVPPGAYKIAVSPGRIMESADEMPLVGKKLVKTRPVNTDIPLKYHKTATSNLQVEVKEGENPPLAIDLMD